MAARALRAPRELTLQDLQVVLLALTVLLLPFQIEQILVPEEIRRVSIFAFDLPAVMLLAVTAPALLGAAARTWRQPFGAAVSVLAVATLLSALTHPEPRAAQALLRLGEAIAVGYVVATVGPRRPRVLLSSLGITVLFQTALATAQLVRGETVGLIGLGEYPGLLTLGELVMPKGTFQHPYVLAGWAAVGSGALLAAAVATGAQKVRGQLAVLVAVAAVPLALTFSRMSVLGLALAAPALAVAAVRRPAFRLPCSALAAGFLVPAALVQQGWLDRAAQTTGSDGSSADAISSGRLEFLRQGLRLVEDAPLLGQGPGQYPEAALRVLDLPPDAGVFPVHNVPVFIAAEAGVCAGVAALVLLAALTLRARRSAAAWAVLALYVPFVMLDWLYGHPQGTPVVGAWVGLVWVLGRPRDAPAPT